MQQKDRLSSAEEQLPEAPIDERSRLLPGTSSRSADEAAAAKNADDERDGLPTIQLFALCWARVIDHWTFCSLFPYLPAFVKRTGVLEADIGLYCGMIESIFAITQVVAMLVWASWSDSYGRKPVLCAAMLGASIWAFLFGLATEVWQMLLLRALAGMTAASAVTVRIMVSEATTSKDRAQAFSYLSTTSQLCMLFAPLVGGGLYDPASQIPWVAKRLPILDRFPALLPALANGCISLGALLSILFLVDETKPKLAKGAKVEESLSHRSVLAMPRVIPVLLMYLFTETFNGAAAINPVFYFTHIELGGWSFSTHSISVITGALGAIGIIYAFFIFAPLTKRFGTRRMFLSGSLLQLLNWSWPMLSNWLLRYNRRAIFWSFLPVFTIVQVVARISSGVSINLAVNNVAPPAAVGLVTGMAFSLASAQRAVVPAAATALFAVSVEKQLLGGYLVWVVLLAWAAAYNLCLRSYADCLEDKKQEGE